MKQKFENSLMFSTYVIIMAIALGRQASVKLFSMFICTMKDVFLLVKFEAAQIHGNSVFLLIPLVFQKYIFLNCRIIDNSFLCSIM